MNARAREVLPRSLSAARRRFDRWRRRHRKHTRLPEDLWRRAVGLAREYGISKTASALGLKYDSLKKHVAETSTAQAAPAKTGGDFIEFLPGVMPSGSMDCTVEWAEPSGATIRMHLKGVGATDLACLAGVLRGHRA